MKGNLNSIEYDAAILGEGDISFGYPVAG